MGFDYLLYILIVLIYGVIGKDFYFVLFFGYFRECIDYIEGFEWFVIFLEQSIVVKILLEKLFNKEKLKKGEKVDKEMFLVDFFIEGVMVGDLMKIFGWFLF